MYVRYKCRYCGNIHYITSIKRWLSIPHLGGKKWLKCDFCDSKKHYMDRVDGRKWLDLPVEKSRDK